MKYLLIEGGKALFRLKNMIQFDTVHIKVEKKHQQTTFLTELMFLGMFCQFNWQHCIKHQYMRTHKKTADLILEGAIAKHLPIKFQLLKNISHNSVTAGARACNAIPAICALLLTAPNMNLIIN